MSQRHDQHQDRDQGQVDAVGGEDTDASRSDGRSIAEWTTLGISLAILLTVVGLVTYLYVRNDDQPATITVSTSLDEIRQDGGIYYLPVDVMNEGDETAEAVQIQAELDTGSGVPETAQLSIQFLAGGEKVQGTIIFSNNPEQGELSIRPVSYNKP